MNFLPAQLPSQVAGIREQAAYDAVREPLLLMGVYFQAQDDYLDAFAPPETLGKIGTDIQEKHMPGGWATKLGDGVWCMTIGFMNVYDTVHGIKNPKIEVAGDF